MADRTPSDLADRLVQHCVNDPHARGLPQMQADMHAAAVLLREQAEQLDIQTALATNYAGKAVEYKQEKERAEEQLDTLRNEVLRHRRMVEGCELVHPLPTLIEQVNGDLWAAAGGGVPGRRRTTVADHIGADEAQRLADDCPVPGVQCHRYVADLRAERDEARRQLDTLRNAGDPDSIRLMADNLAGIGWTAEAEVMHAVADALDALAAAGGGVPEKGATDE